MVGQAFSLPELRVGQNAATARKLHTSLVLYDGLERRSSVPKLWRGTSDKEQSGSSVN